MNNDMKKFIAKLFTLSALVSAVFALWMMTGIFSQDDPNDDGYMASIVDKIARLKSISDPKIILVSGSNLAFGINSPALQDALNMPVVNLGLHGSLGNAFHEGMAKLNINSGDLVIICHHTFSDDDRIHDTVLAWDTLGGRKELWPIIRGKDYPDMIQGWPEHWFNKFGELAGKEKKADSYSRSAFNEYGDVVFKPEEFRVSTDVLFTENKIEVPAINATCIDRLNELNRFITQRRAHMLIAGYPIASGDFTLQVNEYVQFQEHLIESLDCEVISDFKDYFIPCRYFYNTTLHLDHEGAAIRTRQLIQDIKKWRKKHSRLLPAMPVLRRGLPLS